MAQLLEVKLVSNGISIIDNEKFSKTGLYDLLKLLKNVGDELTVKVLPSEKLNAKIICRKIN